MNIRQQRYKSNRILGMNQYNSARAAGYSHNYALKGGSRIEKLAKIGIGDAFEQAGLTDKAIIKHAFEGLAAMRTVSAIITGKDAGAADKDFIDVPDWTARHKYFDTILKMTDRLREKIEHSGKIEGGDARIYIINGMKEENARTLSNPQRIPEKILI